MNTRLAGMLGLIVVAGLALGIVATGPFGGRTQAAKPLGKCGGFVIHQTGVFTLGVAPAIASPPFGDNTKVRVVDGTLIFVAPTEDPYLILGSDSADSIHGSAGNDIICGGEGDDWITGAEGANELSGGAGCDRLVGGSVADRLVGGPGDDAPPFNGSGCASTGLGGGGSGGLFGGPGNDSYNGGPGTDNCFDVDGANVSKQCEESSPGGP